MSVPNDHAEGLREQIARKLSTLTTCHGDEWPSEFHYRQADALLSGPLAPLLAKLRAVEAVAGEEERHHSPVAADRIRRALAGES